MAVRGSRRQKSAVTFGPVGRVLWTLGGLSVLYLSLAPVVRLVRGGLVNAGIAALPALFFGVVGVILLFWVAPRFVRDVWRPASLTGDELTDLRDQTRRELELRSSVAASDDAQPLSKRTAPTRW